MTTMRAKLKISGVTKHEGGWAETLQFYAVSGGTPEDNSFSKATPTAELKICITNPDLMGKFEPGQTFYVDFTPAQA